MSRRIFLSGIAGICALLFVLGCSGSSSDLMSPGVQKTQTERFSSRVPWGFYEIQIRTDTLEASVVPLRAAEFNANVTQFMQPPVSPVNRISVVIDSGASDIPNGIFAVDVTLSHPFPGLSQYSGFDVRGIFMADGTVSSDHYGGLYYATDDESHLLNADGWTRWWNPTEFTTFGTIFGYTKGSLSSPGFDAAATLNPYKYFCDGLGSEDTFVVDPETRGFFHNTSSNTRRYMIQFAMDSGAPVVRFNYAVDASWSPPDPIGAPDYTIDDFSLSANCQEAYQFTVTDAGSDAWYEGPGSSGGDLSMDIRVYDWQAVENPMGVPGEVKAIWVESPDMMASPVDVLPGATISADGPTSSVFHVEVADVHPKGLTGQAVLIGVESSSPVDYAPNLEGISGFDYPLEPLAAYMFWDAPILDEEPVSIPAPTGLDNCAAAGVVKLFWDAVSWPDLEGYNVFRKLSTAPDYDFGNPLNPDPLTETSYIDTSVQMNGTTYDYVVTAVDTDMLQSAPSNETTATPQYVVPTGFTDLDNPDGKMGTGGVSNYINAELRQDGTIALTWDWGPIFVWGNIDGTYGSDVYLGSYASGQAPNVAMDSQGNAHVVWMNAYTLSRAYYYAKITPSGSVQNFTTLHTFTSADSYEAESCIAVTPDDEIHIVLVSMDPAINLIYMHGQPGSFSSPEVLTYDVYGMVYHVRPDMVADRFGNLHLVWTGPGPSAIYYMKRNTAGTWGSIETASAGTGGYPNFADVAVDYLGAVHVAWNRAGTYDTGYSNNRTGSFSGMVIPNSSSSNFVGVACDRDGNAYVDWWNNTRVSVALIDRNKNVVENTFVNDDQPYEGSWCVMAGCNDPCYESDTSVIAFWKMYPPPAKQAQFARIQTDY